jgi:hypothetical protein
VKAAPSDEDWARQAEKAKVMKEELQRKLEGGPQT